MAPVSTDQINSVVNLPEQLQTILVQAIENYQLSMVKHLCQMYYDELKISNDTFKMVVKMNLQPSYGWEIVKCLVAAQESKDSKRKGGNGNNRMVKR